MGERQRANIVRLSFWLTAFALLFGISAPVDAQVDPRVLEQVQRNLGVPQTDAGAQLDRSRENAVVNQVNPINAPTAEELELRRQQSLQQLQGLYKPSAIEQEYQGRLNDRDLRQFGYDLFRSAEGQTGPLTGQVADSYVVGPGDELVVTFQGATNETHTSRVARDGRLIVGSLPPIRAAGRSLGAVRSALSAETRRNLLGTDVYVSLGGVRSATVFIGGEVERPGQYQVSALSDIANAIARAGGIRKSGSLRNVRLVRGGIVRTVDLYGLLGIGAPPATGVQDGDRIVVPVIGHTAAVTGAVARPGIYELRGATNVGELLRYAGGSLRPRGYKISISRIAEDGREIFVRPEGEAAAILASDGVQVIGGSAGGALDRVLLTGYVLNPGPRAVTATPTVSDLVGPIDELRLGTYLPMAALIRRDPATGMREYQAINLAAALDGSKPVQLRGDDRLYVFSEADIAFLNRAEVRQIILGQPNPIRQCASLARLEALVRDTQSPRFNVITRGTFTVERHGQSVAAGTGTALNTGARNADERLPTEQTVSDARDGVVQRQPATSESGGNSQKVHGIGLGLDGRWVICPEVFEQTPELLPFIIEHSVGVGGAVRRPGAYPIAGTASAQTLISAADGILASVGEVTLDLTSTETGGLKRYDLPRDDRAGAAHLMLRPGDDLRVNAASPSYESGAVLLTGEFANPGLYTIRQGERLSDLIARAGGLTPNAYPYGAVFTRRSVREVQQEGFRRTARELNTSLLALAAKKDTNGQAIAAAGELIRTLSTTESAGRMVVEADPRVLTQRPDLDPILEGGDALYVPKTPTFVVVLGDVANPGAQQFIAGKNVQDYIAESGGTEATADDDRTFLVLPNGSAQPIHHGVWRRSQPVVPPGSTIIVPKNLDPLRTLGIVRDVATIFGQLATSAASILIIADRTHN